jgi:uncharacterized membrane protein
MDGEAAGLSLATQPPEEEVVEPEAKSPQASEIHPTSRRQPDGSVVAIGASFQQFAGPLPHPDTLAAYEETLPGAADRILAMAERQAEHRQAMESKVIDSNCRSQERGPILGFSLALVVAGLGGFLSYSGQEISGLVAMLVPLASIVAVFITGKLSGRKELKAKRSEKRDAVVTRGERQSSR